MKKRLLNQDSKCNYQMITLIKVMCAFLVVYIHTYCGKSTFGNMFFVCFTRQAVPFFFIVSGFLLGERVNRCGFDWNYIKKYTINLLIVYCIWSIIWLPKILYTYFQKYTEANIFYLVFAIFRRLVLTGDGVYWYLLVLSEAVIIIAFFVSKKKEYILSWSVFPLLILGIIYEYQNNVPEGELNQLNKICYFLFGSNDNIAMKGLPYCSIGFLLSDKRRRKILDKIVPCCFVWIYIIVSIVSMGIYLYICPYDVAFGAPLQAILLFLIAISYRVRIVNQKFDIRFRNFSSVLYLSHTLFIFLLPKCVVVRWGLAYLIVICCSTLLWLILEKNGNKFLKMIFLMK